MVAWLKTLGDLPTTVIVVLFGILLAFMTALRYLFSGLIGVREWVPSWEWLAFVAGVLSINFGLKRATYQEAPPAGPDIEDVAAEKKR